MRKVVVTGGCGFIGSAFVRLFHEKYDILIVDKFTYAADPIRIEGCKHSIWKEDIAKENWHDELVRWKPDVIVNFAAESHVDRSIHSDQVFLDANTGGTLNLLRYCNVMGCRMVQVSTDEVYGSIREGAFFEHDRFNPRNPYSASKAAAEHFCNAYYATHKIDVVGTRGANTYGPWQYAEKLIPVALKKLYDGGKVPVYGIGAQIRDWLYVDDHAKAIEHVMLHGKAGEFYNVPGTKELQNIDLVKSLIQTCKARGWDIDVDNSIEFVADRKGHDFRYSMNGGKIHSIGFFKTTMFEDGLNATVDHYKRVFDKQKCLRGVSNGNNT